MNRIRFVLIGIAVVAAVQIVGLLLCTLLFYQVTPNSVLARDTFIGRIQPVLLLVRLADRSLNFLYRGPTPPEALPVYRLSIPEDELASIEQFAADADVFLTDDLREWSHGTFEADGETYDVDVRVRGDRFNHWKFKKKSWRIRFPKDHLFRGMRELNLILPSDRTWFAELLNSYRAKKMGFLQPRMEPVTVSFNNSGPLYYLLVEHWTKEMLETQKRPGDTNFYKTGGVQTSSFDGWDPIFEDLGYWEKYTKSAAAPHDSYEDIDLLFSITQKDAHTQPDFRSKVQTIFDIDQLVRWYAHSILAGNLHVSGDNLRFFFNVSLGRFEPIPWDVFLIPPRPLQSLPGNELWNEVFAVPEWRLAVHQYLWDYVKEQRETHEDIEQAQYLRDLIERAAYRDTYKLDSNRQVHAKLEENMVNIQKNLDFLYEELQKSEVLIVQRVPTSDQLANGVQLVLDIIVRGPVASTLLGVELPVGEFTIVQDDGNEVFGPEDTPLSLSTLHALLAPEQPATTDIGIPTEISHTLYRFYIQGSASLAAEMPVPLIIHNAVTDQESTIISIRTVQ